MQEAFHNLVINRHSVREYNYLSNTLNNRYEDKKIPEKVIKEILEEVTTCPTAGNLQAYYVTIVQTDKLKKEIADIAYEQDWIAKAPVMMIFSALPNTSGKKYKERGIKRYCFTDANIACTYAQLSAESRGIRIIIILLLYRILLGWSI